MQVYNQNNIYSVGVNFKANKIATVQRFIEKDTLLEKVDVYRLNNKQDLPFAQKIISFMEAHKKKLNEEQQKLLEQLKDFVNKCCNVRTYIGIKNDEEIVGCMQIDNLTDSFYLHDYNYHAPQIRSINMTSDENIAKDAMRYSALSDTEIIRSKENLANATEILDVHYKTRYDRYNCYNNSFSKYRQEISSRNPEHEFIHANQQERHDLEEVLGI